MRHPIIELFHLSSLLQMPNDHRMVIELLSSSATSRVVLIGSALKILSVGHCQLLMVGHCALHLQGLSCLLNFSNHHCTVRLLAVPRPNALLML